MTFSELRCFAFGELGWTLERYRFATFEEFNKASGGYWRNWERQTAWLMREIVYELIAGNPNYDKSGKPQRSKDIYRIEDDDKVKEEKKKAQKAPDVTEQDIRVMEALNFKKSI